MTDGRVTSKLWPYHWLILDSKGEAVKTTGEKCISKADGEMLLDKVHEVTQGTNLYLLWYYTKFKDEEKVMTKFLPYTDCL